jgi:hypothetical protein
MLETKAAADLIPPHLRKPRLRRAEASEYLLTVHGLPIAASTLAKYATIGGGPSYQKAGITPLYPIDNLDAWAVNRLGKIVRSSSEVGK